MQIILKETIQGLGKLGEIVNVKPGYARNFLLPREKAMPASEANIKAFEVTKKELEKTAAASKTAAEKEAVKLEGVSVTIARNASETGQLYGSVKARDIEAALAESKTTVARSNIMIGQPIRTVGDHTVSVALHPEVIVKLAVEVVRQSN